MNVTSSNSTPPSAEEIAALKAAAEANPSLLPPKFKTFEDFVKSYGELEQAFTRSRQQAPAPAAPSAPATPTAETPAAPSDASATPLQITTPTEKPDQLWQNLRAEISSGDVKEETVAKIRALGVPDDILADALSGIQTNAKNIRSQAAAMVGGEEQLKAILQWAGTALPASEREYLQAGLSKAATWRASMASLIALRNAASPTNGNPAPVPGTSVGGTQKARAFGSPEEMTAAMRDPRYAYDPEYQAMVFARVAETMG